VCVQNLLVMRFSNQFMSAVWDNKNIDNIQITMKEDFGTEDRGGYYDSYGVIRDVVQNHLLQARTVMLFGVCRATCCMRLRCFVAACLLSLPALQRACWLGALCGVAYQHLPMDIAPCWARLRCVLGAP
jgi:Glucose-6-phosphate dehydrogenase, C-terminal domain